MDYILRSLGVFLLAALISSPFLKLNIDLIIGILTDSKQSNVYWELHEILNIHLDSDFFRYESTLNLLFLISLYFLNWLIAFLSYKCSWFKFLKIDLSKISPWENFRQLRDAQAIVRVDMRLKNGTLYSGLFADYYWDAKEEKVDLIRIEEPKMRPLNEVNWVHIPSSRFFINLQEVASINFRLLSSETETTLFPFDYDISKDDFLEAFNKAQTDVTVVEDITQEETVIPAPEENKPGNNEG